MVAARLLAAESADEARHVIRRHLRPTIRRDGRVIYQLSDGGTVSDEARVVRVSQVTDGAAFFALSLASERFGPRPLVVRCSPGRRSLLSPSPTRSSRCTGSSQRLRT